MRERQEAAAERAAADAERTAAFVKRRVETDWVDFTADVERSLRGRAFSIPQWKAFRSTRGDSV